MPREVLDALAEVEVTVVDVGTSGFKLTFSIDKQSPLQILFLLSGGMPLLFMHVVLVVTVNGVATVLMDGVITNNQIAPGNRGSNSTLTIMGKDLTALMDPWKLSGFPFPALPGGREALSPILLTYAIFWRGADDHPQRDGLRAAAHRPAYRASRVPTWNTSSILRSRRATSSTSVPGRCPAHRTRPTGGRRSRSARFSPP